MSEQTEPAIPQSVWTRRRRVVFGTLLFCAAAVAACFGYTVASGTAANSILDTIITMSYMLAGTTIAAYCGFATWDDKARNDALASILKKG